MVAERLQRRRVPAVELYKHLAVARCVEVGHGARVGERPRLGVVQVGCGDHRLADAQRRRVPTDSRAFGVEAVDDRPGRCRREDGWQQDTVEAGGAGFRPERLTEGAEPDRRWRDARVDVLERQVGEGAGRSVVADRLTRPQPAHDVDVVEERLVAGHLQAPAAEPPGVPAAEAEDEPRPERRLHRGAEAGRVQRVARGRGDDPGGDVDAVRPCGDGAEDDPGLLQIPALGEERAPEAEGLGVHAVLDPLRDGAGVGLVAAARLRARDHAAADDVGAEVVERRRRVPAIGTWGVGHGRAHRSVANASSSAAWVSVRRTSVSARPRSSPAMAIAPSIATPGASV